MKTDLEERFFEAFDLGGVALSCVRLLIDNEMPIEWEQAIQNEKQRVINETQNFDFSIVNSNRKAPIIEEIEDNIHFLTGVEREHYLYSLLLPFGEWVRLAKGRVDDFETDWSKQNAKDCAKIIFDIINGEFPKDTVEYSLQMWYSAFSHYCNRLDALLLQEGIDIFNLQDETGVKLILYRDISALEFYIGSYRLAQKYINNLTSTPQPDYQNSNPDTSTDGIRLPQEADTDRARKYIARAIERGLIKYTPTELEWQAIGGRGGNSQLGYFLSKIYEQPRPISALEKLFDVKKLSTYIGNANYEIKRADVKRWRTEIDNLFIE